MVLMDEGRVVLASRVVAFLLEGAEPLPEDRATAAGLLLCGQVLRAAGSDQALRQAASVEKQAAQLEQGRTPRVRSCAAALLDVIRARRGLELAGVPDEDWLSTRRMLADAPMSILQEIAKASAQLATLGLRRRIASGLMDLWHKHGSYLGAQRILEAAVSEEHLLGGVREMRGTSIMTIHKAKGREFDGVVVYHGSHSDSLVYRDAPPYARSRRLLRVGVTRAKHQVLLLTTALDPLPAVLAGHRF